MNKINYFSFGNGSKPFVMLPGASIESLVLSKDAIASAFSSFEKDYTVHFFDYIEDIYEGTTVEDLAEDVAEKMNELGLKNTYMFGCSLGGCIAQCLAIDHPKLVGKLILASSYSKQNDYTKKIFSEWEALSKNGEGILLTKNMQSVIYSAEFYEKFKDEFKALETNGSKEEITRFAHVSRALLNFDKYEELSKIKCETFVIGSLKDNTLGPQASKDIAQKLNCPIYLYDGYGHAVYDEAPDYKEKIAKFFEGEIS